MKDYGDEQVFVVPRDLLFDGAAPQGFTAGGVDALLARALTHGRFVPRGPAETDASLQQVIPYVVLVRHGQVWLMQRLATQTEQRLHNLYSIGVGGHINPEDALNGTDPIVAGLTRELHEEIAIDGPLAGVRPLGILKDDSNAVGQVHVGVVFEAEVDGVPVSVREADRMTGRFVTLDEARAHREGMESWSQHLLDALKVLLVLAWLPLAGCVTLSALGNAATHTVAWQKDGFVVEDIRRKFTYDADGPSEEAELDGRLTLTDRGADGTVDVVKGDGGEWRRGEPGSDEVFADADERFAATRAYLRIDGYRAKFERMTEADRADAAGLYRRP